MLKKILVLFLLGTALVLVECGNIGVDPIKTVDFSETDTFKLLNQVAYPDADYSAYETIGGEGLHVEFLQSFMNKIVKALFVGVENYVFSPISLYMALAMLAEGADGETQSELFELLEIGEVSELRPQMQAIYEHNHYANENGTAQMANSIWIHHSLPVETAFLDILANQYFAEAYGTAFDDEGEENIIDWINTNTHDLLGLTKDNYPIDPNLALLLLNTVYFDNKWDQEFRKSDNYFADFNDTVEDVEYMKHTIVSRYYQGENVEIVFDIFKNGNSIQYLLPSDDSSVAELLQSDIFQLGDVDYTDVEARISVPKFSTKSKYELNDTLISLGCSRMFTPSAQFSKISDHDLMVDFVKQDAGIILSEEGVKAAAVSGIGMVETAIPTYPFVEVVLDRPFLYVIYDSNRVPLFVGVMNNPRA